MELERLIKQLSSPNAYPALQQVTEVTAYPGLESPVEVIQTHASVVFRIQDLVFKIKKPVDLGFLDYSTLEKRKAMCEAEVAINAVLAPQVYLGVVPIAKIGNRIVAELERGEVVEWAVKMQRLPDHATLEAKLQDGSLEPRHLESVTKAIARFHDQASASSETAAMGRFEVVERNCEENFRQLGELIEAPGLRDELETVANLTRAALVEHRELIEARASRGVPRDTHGDLRLDHVYLLEGDAEPTIIDRIEFNPRFRGADPVADIAFLIMDMQAHGGWREALTLEQGYFAAREDDEGHRLLPLYVAYRATVRAKVAAMLAAETEIPDPQRRAARRRVRARLRLARGALTPPAAREVLVIVSGLPGTGKSVLSKGLSKQGFEWVRSDIVRKELAGIDPSESGLHFPGGGLYTAEWTDRTYKECRDRVDRALRAGQRVVVDATFIEAARRLSFIELASDLGVPSITFLCELDDATVRERLAARTGDASDADVGVYEKARERMQAMTHEDGWVVPVSTAGTPEATVELALQTLRRAKMA